MPSMTPIIQHVQNVAGAPGHWPDEFLAWYKREEWEGEHRAAAVFLGEKVHTLLSELERLRAQVAPAGWKLVPVESSAAMEWAWERAEVCYLDGRGRMVLKDQHSAWKARYAAMLAASPAAPAQQADKEPTHD